MNDDGRKLMGGYATGSLSEAERRRLFEAALEDQDLFDELAREQALKELLDQPDAKERLMAALGAGKRAIVWWKRPGIWALGGVAAAIIAAVTLTVTRTPAPVVVARLAEPAPAPVVPQPALPPLAVPRVHKSAAKPSAPVMVEQNSEKKAADRLSNLPPVPVPPKDAPAVVQQQAEAKPPATAVTPAAGFLPGARAVPVAPMRSLAAPAAAPPVPGLALDYQIHGQALDLRFLSSGFVSLHFSPLGDEVSAVRVAAGSSRQEPIPAGTTEVTIVLSAAADTDGGGVSLTRESLTGRIADPSGTRIELKLRIP